jgi:O-antigen/teichoic acid export membrane protein
MTIAKTHPASLLRSIAATYATRIVATFLGLLTSVIVARSLGPEGRGSFAAAMVLAGIGMQFGNLGLPASNTYFLSRDRRLLTSIVASSVLVALLWGGIVAAILAAAARLTDMANSTGSGLIELALASVPIGIAYMLLVNLLIPLFAVTKFNQIELGFKIATVILTLAVIACSPAGPFWFVAAGLAAQVLALGAVWLSLRQPMSSLTAVSFDLLRKQVPFAFRSYLASLLAFVLLRSDMLMVQHISGNAEAGQYSIAVAMADSLYILPASVGLLLFPRLSAETDGHLRRRETLRMLVQIGVAMAVIGMVAALLATPFVSILFGPRFIPAVQMFHILILAIVAYGMNNILSNHMAADGMPWSAVWVWAVALAVNVVLNVIWIPGYGGRGAAFASLVAYTVVLVIQAVLIFRPNGNVK